MHAGAEVIRNTAVKARLVALGAEGVTDTPEEHLACAVDEMHKRAGGGTGDRRD